MVEAVAPEFDRWFACEQKRDEPLIDLIEAFAPNGWTILVETLPRILPGDSKSEFKAMLRELREQRAPEDSEASLVFQRTTSRGDVKLKLLAGVNGQRVAAAGPVYVGSSDAKQRITRAIRKKRKQVRCEDEPVILAVHATGLAADLDHFDNALFGHLVATAQVGHSSGTHFEADGMFADGTGEPTFAGVLAFTDLPPFGSRGPTLHVHPRATCALPRELDDLEKRTLEARGIDVSEARRPNLLADIR